MEAPAPDRADLLLVCSTGGHLLQLVALREAWQPFTRAWVTFDKSDARSLLADERVYFAHGPTNRSIKNMLRNLWVAWRVLARGPAEGLVTTGAGVAVPFAWVARLRGAKVVYVESLARIEGPSLTLPIDRADRQPPLRAVAGARGGRGRRAVRGQRLFGRRMIFVSVGTNEARFDRLLHAVAELGLDEEVVVQHGHSARDSIPPARQLVDFLPFEGIVDTVRRSRVVVTHAGVGSVMVSLANGKRPIVVPRRKAFAEAVDDHQLAARSTVRERGARDARRGSRRNRGRSAARAGGCLGRAERELTGADLRELPRRGRRGAAVGVTACMTSGHTSFDTIASRIRRGVAWKAGSQISLQITRMVVALVLARLLAPHDWGLAAMVLVFSGFVIVFTDSALGTALIQRRDLSDADRSTVFWMSVGIGVLLAVGGMLLAGPLARFFEEPEVRPMLASCP